jgi:hypothetical protein
MQAQLFQPGGRQPEMSPGVAHEFDKRLHAVFAQLSKGAAGTRLSI